MKKTLKGITVILLLVFFWSSIAYGNSSYIYRNAGTVEPMNNNDIRMVEENVHIKTYGGFSIARCEFVFKNESDNSQNVLMGFPALLMGVGSEEDETTRVQEFKVYDNGVEIQAKLEKDAKTAATQEYGDILEWHTWDVAFEGKEERRIVNTYTTQNYNAPWERRIGYIVTTGKPWKGTIGRAVITFELMDIPPSKLILDATSPKGFQVNQNKIIWEFTEFEPEENLVVTLEPGVPLFDLSLQDIKDESLRQQIYGEISQGIKLINEGKVEEGKVILTELLTQKIYCEPLYFALLNYYKNNDDLDQFIEVLKEQVINLNSPNIYEWAYSIYPERVQEEGITYPESPGLYVADIVKELGMMDSDPGISDESSEPPETSEPGETIEEKMYDSELDESKPAPLIPVLLLILIITLAIGVIVVNRKRRGLSH